MPRKQPKYQRNAINYAARAIEILNKYQDHNDIVARNLDVLDELAANVVRVTKMQRQAIKTMHNCRNINELSANTNTQYMITRTLTNTIEKYLAVLQELQDELHNKK